MIRSRQALPADFKDIQRLLGPDMFVPERDFAAISTLEGHVSGVILARPVVLVHGLGIEPGPTARHQASQLTHYAWGFLKAMGHKEAIFICDPPNARIQSYVEDVGAVKDRPGVIYFREVS